MGAAYFRYDFLEDPPPEGVKALIKECEEKGIQILLGCDVNAHHIVWGSSNCNKRGNELLEYLAGTDMAIMNKDRTPTFRDKNREEVLDITLASGRIGG